MIRTVKFDDGLLCNILHAHIETRASEIDRRCRMSSTLLPRRPGKMRRCIPSDWWSLRIEDHLHQPPTSI